MRVQNINGTSDNTCRCGSWLAHWSKFGADGQQPGLCSAQGCRNTAEAGAHVQKESSSDRSWYIIPLCNRHNVKVQSLTVSESTRFAPANVADTCGRKK